MYEKELQESYAADRELLQGKSKEPLWTKNYIMHLLVYFLVFIVFYLFMIYTTRVAMTEFSTSVSEAGFASGLFIVSAIFARMFAGRYMDFIGRKKLMLISGAGYFIFTLGYHIVSSLTELCILRFLHGITYGIIATVIGAVSVSIIPASRRGEGLGYFSLSMTLGAAIGPFLGVTLPQINPLYALILCDVVSLFIFLLTFLLHVPEIKVGFRQRVMVKTLKLSTFIEPKALGISVVALLGAMGYSAIMSYIGTYSESINLLLGGSLFYVVYSIVCLVSRPLTGIVLDKWGNDVVMIPVLFLMIFGFLAVAWAENNVVLLVGAALIAIGYGTIPSAGQAIAVQNVKPQQYGMATATFYMALDTGNGIGPSILGQIVPIYGFRAVYVCSAFFAACAFVYYCVYAYVRHKKTSE